MEESIYDMARFKKEVKFKSLKQHKDRFDDLKHNLKFRPGIELDSIYQILNAHMDYWKDENGKKNKIEMIHSKKNPGDEYIKITLYSISHPTKPVIFKVRLILYKKPYIIVNAAEYGGSFNYSDIFRYDILKSNFLNMLMAWFNSQARVIKFNVTEKEYRYITYQVSRLALLY